jgi:hypothetical protein
MPETGARGSSTTCHRAPDRCVPTCTLFYHLSYLKPPDKQTANICIDARKVAAANFDLVLGRTTHHAGYPCESAHYEYHLYRLVLQAHPERVSRPLR